MNHSHDDAIDALVRKQFDGPVRDDGFSERLMQKLPPRRRRSMWPLITGILAGTAACWLSLMSTSSLDVGWHDWMSGELSASAITFIGAIFITSLLAFWWTTMEATDH